MILNRLFLLHDWQEMTFHETSEHVHINSADSYTFYNTYFIECKADNGGSIYSKQTGTNFYILCCVFENSSAIGEGSVGGAINIDGGSSIFQNICTDNCFCYHGGDIRSCGDNIRYENIQSSRCIAGHHGSAFGCQNMISKNVNISYNDINMEEDMMFFGSAISFDKIEKSIIKYINTFKNSGRKSVIGFGYIYNTDITVEFVNLIENDNHNSFFCCRESENINFYVSSSSFINNRGNDYCSIESTSSNIKTTFSNSKFSMYLIEQTSNNVILNSCKFDIKNDLIKSIEDKCFKTNIKCFTSIRNINKNSIILIGIYIILSNY